MTAAAAAILVVTAPTVAATVAAITVVAVAAATITAVVVSSRDKVCLLIGCLTSQQQASVSQGRICSDKLTCYHTEIEDADQTFYFTRSQYTDTRPTSPSTDPVKPGA